MMIGPIDNDPKQPQRPQGQSGSQGQQSQRSQGQLGQQPQRPQGQQVNMRQTQQVSQGQEPRNGQMHEPPGQGQQGQGKAPKSQKKAGGVLPTWLVIILRILRFFLVPALLVAALFIGLAIGYSTIGGESASDVFKIETWKHLYDLVFEGT
jgi:hypothetical protein